MKHALFFITLLIVAPWAQAQVADGNYTCSVPESVIHWKVDFSVTTKGHEGTLNLTSGSVLVKGGIIQSGNFIIDMNTIHVTDLKPEDAKGLEEHLRGTDFFETSEHPTGTFTVLKSVRNAPGKFTFSGTLVLKGISNTITFPATITETKNSLVVSSEFIINRTLWGINYQSGVIGTLKDDLISDDILVKLNLTFKKAQ